MKKILLIASYDSFLKTGFSVAKTISEANIDIFIHSSKRNILSSRQLDEFGLGDKDIIYFHIDDFFKNKMYRDYDVVILSIGNGPISRFFDKQNFVLQENGKIIKKPVIITLFPGVIFGDEASILARMQSDIILYNCKHDYKAGEKIKNRYNFQCNNVLYGYPAIERNLNVRVEKVIKEVFFIDQVKIPAKKEERILILKYFSELANRFPDKNFTILLRVTDADITVHKNTFPYDKLIKNIEIPKNLSIERRKLSEALDMMDCCLSISSTVIFEALAKKIEVGVIGNLGFKKEYANEAFRNSNLVVDFQDIDFNNRREIDSHWIEEYLSSPINKEDTINQAISTVLSENKSYEEYNYKKYKKIIKKERPFLIAIYRKLKKLVRDPKRFILDSFFYRIIFSGFIKIKKLL